MKTQAEIVDRLVERRKDDHFGFEWQQYASALDRHHIGPFLHEGVVPDEWKPGWTAANLFGEMKDYMQFAWDKANNCRGISANRSVMYYVAWLWLNGDDAASAAVQKEFDGNYCFYGKPILAAICEFYGWDWKQWDDGKWRTSEDGSAAGPPEQPIFSLGVR